jgi:hypothetical protein
VHASGAGQLTLPRPPWRFPLRAAEDSFRFSLFQNSLARVVAKNAKLPAGKPNFGLNKFSDMDPNEWAQMYLAVNPTDKKKQLLETFPVRAPKAEPSAIPASWDWRDHNAVTMVKDQGQCGSVSTRSCSRAC